MGKLQICICAARNSCDAQQATPPDLYCRVRVDDKMYQTKVVNDTCSPVWNETFRFQVTNEGTAQGCVELWSRNVVCDDILGSFVFSVSNLTKGVVQDAWHMLAHSKTNAEVRIRMLACDFGKKPLQDDLWKITGDISVDPALNAAAKPPFGGAPRTVAANNNSTPITSNMGPAVVPVAVLQEEL